MMPKEKNDASRGINDSTDLSNRIEISTCIWVMGHYNFDSVECLRMLSNDEITECCLVHIWFTRTVIMMM